MFRQVRENSTMKVLKKFLSQSYKYAKVCSKQEYQILCENQINFHIFIMFYNPNQTEGLQEIPQQLTVCNFYLDEQGRRQDFDPWVPLFVDGVKSWRYLHVFFSDFQKSMGSMDTVEPVLTVPLRGHLFKTWTIARGRGLLSALFSFFVDIICTQHGKVRQGSKVKWTVPLCVTPRQ